jgi:hypothetical protein
MTTQDEARRDALTDAFAKASIDARNLRVEAVDGALLVNGTVPDHSARTGIQVIIATGQYGPAIQFNVGVAKVARTARTRDQAGRSRDDDAGY